MGLETGLKSQPGSTRLCRNTCAFLLVWKSPSMINVKLASFPRNQPNLTYPCLGFTPLLLPENLNQARFSLTLLTSFGQVLSA